MSGADAPGWTDAARRALERAPETARALRHHVAGPDHLLLALLEVEGCRAVRALAILGIAAPGARAAILRHLRPGEDSPTRTPPLSPLAGRALALATAAAAGGRADTAHLLLALLGEGRSPLATAMDALGASPRRIREVLPDVETEA